MFYSTSILLAPEKTVVQLLKVLQVVLIHSIIYDSTIYSV